MISAFSWLNDLMVWLAKWVPRLTLVQLNAQGVQFRPRGVVQLRTAGLIFWWPIVHNLVLVSIADRSAEVASQLHGREAISLVVRWRITDARIAVTRLNQPEAYLDDRVQAALSASYDPHVPNAELQRLVLAFLLSDFVGLGIEIQSVDVAQRGRVVPIKMLQDYAVHATAGL